MKYDDEFVKRISASVIDGLWSIREASKKLKIARNTISTWVSRTKAGLPARFKRSAKNVWNRTSDEVLDAIKKPLESGKTVIQAWQASGKKTCIRTVERWNSEWFQQIDEKKPCKRYVRKHVFSLVHTDWAVKRIKDGKRTCFTFYEDDASRKMFALKGYKKASLPNTIANLHLAWKETKGFKAVLSDCGRVYTKAYGLECKKLMTKSIHTRPYNPKCNGKAEAVVKKVKAFLNKHEVRNLKHMNELLKEFQKEYNNTPHSSLKYMSPNEVFRAKQRTGSVWAVG